MRRWLRRLVSRFASRFVDAPFLVPNGVTATIIVSPGSGVIVRGRIADVEGSGHLTLIFEESPREVPS